MTGKGGAGKTTVAAALGVAAAAGGRHTLVCDLAGDGRDGEVRLGKDLRSLSIDPRAALIEWMRSQPGGALAAPVLGRSTAFTHFVDAAPGAKELVTSPVLGGSSTVGHAARRNLTHDQHGTGSPPCNIVGNARLAGLVAAGPEHDHRGADPRGRGDDGASCRAMLVEDDRIGAGRCCHGRDVLGERVDVRRVPRRLRHESDV